MRSTHWKGLTVLRWERAPSDLQSAGAHSSKGSTATTLKGSLIKGVIFFLACNLAIESLIKSRHLPELVSEVTEGWLLDEVLLERAGELLKL